MQLYYQEGWAEVVAGQWMNRDDGNAIPVQVSLPLEPRVGSVLVSLAQGKHHTFTVFLVTVREGNTAEYKPCASYTGLTDQVVEVSCAGEEIETGRLL